jgi:hypothetical protein
MPHIDSHSSRPAIAALVIVLASLALAACGSSTSTSSTTTASASANTSSTGTTKGAPGAGAGRFAALRECLQKNGITLPKPTPGKRPAPGAGGFLGGGRSGSAPKLPAGVTRAKYEATVKKCGGFARGGFAGGTRAHFNSPAIKQALAKFAACLRTNGIDVPEANTSGKGPIFSTKGLNTASAKFKMADAKCRSDLQGAFRARPGAGGTPGASG